MNNNTPNGFQPITLTGKVRIPAQRTIRNGNPTYVAFIPFKLLFEIIERIVPDTALAANRKVESKRLPEIGNYFIEEKDHWIFPPILVDTQDDLEFIPFAEQQFVNSTEPGSGVLPYRIEGGYLVVDNARKILTIMDGQHRFMGNLLKYEELIKKLNEAKAMRLDFIKQEDKVSENIVNEKIKSLQENVDRYANETLTVEIISLVSESLHKRWFTKIADKAEGINTSARTRLDEISISSIVTNLLADGYPLFIDKDGDSKIEKHSVLAKKSSEELYTLANIRDWVKLIAFGTTDKATLRRENFLEEVNLKDTTETFLDTLNKNTRIFQDILAHRIIGKEFRQKSLWSSPTIIRALAGSFHDICVEKEEKGEKITLQLRQNSLSDFGQMISQLDKYTDYVVVGKKLDIHSNWRKIGSTSSTTGGHKDTVFRSSGIAPQSGFQERQVLVDLFVQWVNTGKVFEPLTVPKRKGVK